MTSTLKIWASAGTMAQVWMILSPFSSNLLMWGVLRVKTGMYCNYFDTVQRIEITFDHHLMN